MARIQLNKSAVTKNNAIKKTLKQYFKTTTLHGFKYLYTAYCIDSLGWLLCCCIGACCAGLLCAVLWERFLELPALLTVWDQVGKVPTNEKVPDILICPPVETIAEIILEKLSPNKKETNRIPLILQRLFTGQPVALDQLVLLENVLLDNNMTLREVMIKYSPSCDTLVTKCRYQGLIVPCGDLFEKALTILGQCCLMTSNKLLKLPQNLIYKSHNVQMMDFVLQTTHESTVYGCQLITSYEHEEISLMTDSIVLLPGNLYSVYMRFMAILENEKMKNLVKSSCVSVEGYSRAFCMLKCAEESCGCSDPLHRTIDAGVTNLPICPVSRMGCIRTRTSRRNMSCNCLPPCKLTTMHEMWQSSKLDIDYTVIDPIYSGINVTSSIVLSLRVNVPHSRIFVLNPTETWLTLLSSLGGIFNMFLGVGLFSALEFLFLILVKLPKAIKKSSEIGPVTTSVGRY